MIPLNDLKSHVKCWWTRLLLNDTLHIKHFLYSILLEQISLRPTYILTHPTEVQIRPKTANSKYECYLFEHTWRNDVHFIHELYGT